VEEKLILVVSLQKKPIRLYDTFITFNNPLAQLSNEEVSALFL